MTAIDYTRFGTPQLDHLERDLRDRLEGRLKLRGIDDVNHGPNSDPVAKRLGFLLAKARNRRRAAEREFAMRPDDNSDQCRDGEPGYRKRCTEESVVTRDYSSAAKRHKSPALVA